MILSTTIKQLKSLTVSLFVIVSLVMLLSGCNGHNDSTSNVDKNSIIQTDAAVNSKQSTELTLYFPNDDVSNIQWQQLSGETVTLLANNSKVAAFTPLSSGNYSFEVSFSLNNGSIQHLNRTVTVTQETSKISARLGHSVLSDNKVSLRVTIDNSLDTNSIQWRQTSGPNISFTENEVNGQLAVFFDAPKVSEDTIISFKVSASDGNQSYSDMVAILVEPVPPIANNAYFEERVATVFPYNASSPYANNLVDCVYSNTLTSSCTLAKLPLLAAEDSTPSINNIMDRVVVSHQWMGDRFKEFLINSDTNNDFTHLLRATTAIIISYDIRPSFYWAATGAIYLDAENFWLTPAERDTINEAPDYRADFGNDLQFIMPWRYVKDNDYANTYIDKNTRVNRSINDGFYRLTSLLYHELAHANDFFPYNEWFIHNSDTRVLDAALSSDFESDQLAIVLPLQSSEMRDLAQVSFGGETANTTQQSYLPTDIQEVFTADSATDFYAYSSEREDYAMLFEELMMQSRFNVFRDVAITNQPSGDNITSRDYIVTWGQRGRIGDELIKPRVAFSASRVLPEFNSTTALAVIPTPVAMIEGDNWLENLTISPVVAAKAKQSSRLSSLSVLINEKINDKPMPLQYRYYQKTLPKN